MKTYFRFLLSLTAAFGVLLSAVAETVPEGLTDLTEPVQANVSTSVSTFFDGSGPFYAAGTLIVGDGIVVVVR